MRANSLVFAVASAVGRLFEEGLEVSGYCCWYYLLSSSTGSCVSTRGAPECQSHGQLGFVVPCSITWMCAYFLGPARGQCGMWHRWALTEIKQEKVRAQGRTMRAQQWKVNMLTATKACASWIQNSTPLYWAALWDSDPGTCLKQGWECSSFSAPRHQLNATLCTHTLHWKDLLLVYVVFTLIWLYPCPWREQSCFSM